MLEIGVELKEMKVFFNNIFFLLNFSKLIKNFFPSENDCIIGIGVVVENELAIRNCTVLPYRTITSNASDEILIWFFYDIYLIIINFIFFYI